MYYLVLGAVVISLSYFYERLKTKNKISKGIRWLFYGLICFTLCLFAGLRTDYNDTTVYIANFEKTSSEFSSLFAMEFKISEVYLFKIWNYFIFNFVSQNANVYLFLCAIIFVCPAVYLIEKYSKNFIVSMVLFMFGGMYLFSLAGLKQAMATGVVLMALPKLINKQYAKYYLYSIIAIGFHAYSIFFLIVPLLGVEILNKRTVGFCLGIVFLGLLLNYFTGAITSIIEFLGKEISEEIIKSGSVNVIRAFVYLVPFILTIIANKNLDKLSDAEKIFIKLGVLSSIFMVLALFGNPILFGRIPQYFLIGIVISLPILIEETFIDKEIHFIFILAVLCYVAYGLYALYIDGAFVKDIFALII